MAKVTRTELNQQTARVLGRVVAGERITITDRGRPIAEIVPATPSRWDELVAAGRIVPASATGPLPFEPTPNETSSAAMIDDIRADRA